MFVGLNRNRDPVVVAFASKKRRAATIAKWQFGFRSGPSACR